MIPLLSSVGAFGRCLNVWDWTTRCLVQSIDLGEDSVPFMIRFLHTPDAPHGFVNCFFEGSVHHIFKKEVNISRISFSFPLSFHWKQLAPEASAENKGNG